MTAYPGTFPGGLTTGYLVTGAVQKQTTGDKAYPGTFPGGLTTSYMNIGGVKKQVTTPPTSTVKSYGFVAG